MSYKLSPIGATPFVIGGDPLVGGKVFTYITNTTTPFPTYTDSTGSDENPNPVILDQYGLAQIWLSSVHNYKLVIKSADEGTTYATLDNQEGLSFYGTAGASSSFDIIYDTNTNPSIGLTATASAVNYIQVTNAAASSNPEIQAAGADANLSLVLKPKGTGTVSIPSNGISVVGGVTSTSVTALTSQTGTKNDYDVDADASNTVTIATTVVVTITGIADGSAGRHITIKNLGPDNVVLKHANAGSLAANRLFLSTATDVTLATGYTIKFEYIGTTWSEVGSSINIPQATAIALIPLVASQAQVEAASSTSVFVSPGRQQYHPGTAKAWVNYSTDPTTTARALYNVSSLTDVGVGETTVNWDTDFSSTAYSVLCQVGVLTVSANAHVVSLAAGSCSVHTHAFGIDADADQVMVAAYGDQ